MAGNDDIEISGSSWTDQIGKGGAMWDTPTAEVYFERDAKFAFPAVIIAKGVLHGYPMQRVFIPVLNGDDMPWTQELARRIALIIEEMGAPPF